MHGQQNIKKKTGMMKQIALIWFPKDVTFINRTQYVVGQH